MQKEYYYAAAYLRLSKEDRMGHILESNSIHSQRDLIDSFVSSQDNMEIYESYIEMKIAY